MVEKDGHRMLNASFRALGGWSYKIPDMPRFGESRFIPGKPFDGISVYDNNAYLWEMKFLRNCRGFNPEKELRGTQLKAMSEIYRNILPGDKIYPVVVLFLYELRRIKQFIFFDFHAIIRRGLIPKREILEYSKSYSKFDIKNGITDLRRLREKIIY